MLWPKFTDEQSALRLAYLGSIRDEIVDGEELSIALLEDLAARVPDLLAQRYKKLDAAQAGEALLEGVCKSRGFILPGGVLDLERGRKDRAQNEFRAGKIGRISLERPEDIRAAEPAGEAASAKPEELPWTEKELQRLFALTEYERPFWESNRLVGGADEAGRGPLAGRWWRLAPCCRKNPLLQRQRLQKAFAQKARKAVCRDRCARQLLAWGPSTRRPSTRSTF